MRCFRLVALELLRAHKNRGARLTLDGEKFIVQGYLIDVLRKQIRTYKWGLIKLMQAGECRWSPVEPREFTWNDSKVKGSGLVN